MGDPLIDLTAAGRPYPGETVSGDDWQADWHEGTCRIAVVDGLGHGPLAANAARAARDRLAAHPELGPVEALYACHQALTGTRGAAMWIVQIVPGSHLSYAGAGNVRAQLWQGDRQQHLTAQRGIVGATLPRLRAYQEPLQADWLLLIHTDGIHERFRHDPLTVLPFTDLQSFAERVLVEWGRETDDALVVISRPARPG